MFQHPLTFKRVFRAACGKVAVWGLWGSGQGWEVEAVMNEMLIVEFFFFPPPGGGSGRSTPAHLHQHIVSAFVFALAAETLWQGSRGLGIYKQGESEFGTRAENRSASSPKQLLFLPVDPGGLKYSTLLRCWKPHTPGREQWRSSAAGLVSNVSGSDDITDLCLQKDWRRSFLSHARRM